MLSKKVKERIRMNKNSRWVRNQLSKLGLSSHFLVNSQDYSFSTAAVAQKHYFNGSAKGL